MKQDYIKAYWEKQGREHTTSHDASWGDKFAIELEIQTIGKYFSKNYDILDIGCANGWSGFRLLEKHQVKSYTGIDIAESMIEAAKTIKAKNKYDDSINFEIGDIRSLRYPDETFDFVYTTRVLINLPTWEEQKLAILECLRVTKNGGKIIFSEAFWEPLILLNALRSLKQLPPLVEHDFNRYLKGPKLEEFLNSKNLKFAVDDFSSIYYLGSRFLRELVTDASAYPGFTNPINEIFYNIEQNFSGGGFGIQKAYIIEV